MSHEITIREDGFAEAAFSLEPAWHGLGTVFDHRMSSGEALTAAGLDWAVVQEDVFRRGNYAGTYDSVSGYQLNVRGDNGFVLGMVSDQYKLVQNREAFEFLDALVENHEMRYESAFSLYGGRRVVMLARMPGVETVARDDHILPYVLMSLCHDGTGAIKFGPVTTRVVCANTYAMAEREGTARELSIRHTGDIKEKLVQARDILGIASRQFAQYAEIGRQLAERRLNREEWIRFLDIMCPDPDPLDPDYTPRRAEQITETRHAIIGCFHGERQSLEGIEESAWAAYNAVAEHIDHLPRRGATRERKAEARFNVTMFGAGRDMKRRALQTACNVAGLELAV